MADADDLPSPLNGDDVESPPDPQGEAELHALVWASPFLMSLWKHGFRDPRELERIALRALALKDACASMPTHVQRAERDPDYWNRFYASMPNW